MKKPDSKMEYLFEGILTLKTVEECAALFDDLCTINEVIEMSNRMAAAKMLSEGKTYTEIMEKTGLSTATISRVNRCIKYGSDGYTAVLERLNESGKSLRETEDE